MMAVRARPRLVPPPDDNTLVIVLRNPSQVIDRELAAPDDAARIAILMIARRARLEAGDLLTVARAEVDAKSGRNLWIGNGQVSAGGRGVVGRLFVGDGTSAASAVGAIFNDLQSKRLIESAS